MAALSFYLDTSVLVPLFVPDVFVNRAKSILEGEPTTVVVSDFVAAEFCSVVGIRFRNKALTSAAAQAAFSNFDSWCGRYAASVEMLSVDIDSAKVFLRRLDLTLRTPDAVSLAIVERIGAQLVTFDSKMANCARKLGIPVLAA